MAQFLPQSGQFPLEEQIKTLADDELLDFWEETQFLEKMLGQDLTTEGPSSNEYERLILMELQVRACQRTMAR